jgi:hypothetical protein
MRYPGQKQSYVFKTAAFSAVIPLLPDLDELFCVTYDSSLLLAFALTFSSGSLGLEDALA